MLPPRATYNCFMSVSEYMELVAGGRKAYTSDLKVVDINFIPQVGDTKLEVNEWARVDQAVAVYADMRGSTQLSSAKSAATLGKMYELFTGSWISVLRSMQSQYIDIKGDGGFGLFYGKAGVVQAVLSAVTFNTIIDKKLSAYASGLTDGAGLDWRLEAKIGIHVGSLLVKRVGVRNTAGQQGNWLVWAGKPVNYASKLASLAEGNTILATHRVLDKISSTQVLADHLMTSCGCPVGNKGALWTRLPDESEIARMVGGLGVWELKSKWCDEHGDEYFNEVREYLTKLNVEVGVDPL